MQPIMVKKGHHLHVSVSYYLPSLTEKFCHGKDGNNFATVKNQDKGMFSVKVSRFGSASTTVDYGQMPGLLYKFA